MGKTVGADVGGTWLRTGIIEDGTDGARISLIEKHPTPDNWDHFVEMLERCSCKGAEGIGVAISGPIADHARVLKGPNLPWLEGRNVRHELETALGKRVVVSNDMEAAAEGEMARGVLRRFTWALFDTISTGWGGNLILNGMRVDSEPGHANITFDSPYRCGSGHVGCREALYSGTAMERRIGEALGKTFASSSEAWGAFHNAIGRESEWAVTLLDDWAEGVGRAWANDLNRVRPMQAIVYMGMTAESLLSIPRAQARVRQTLQRICMYPQHSAADFPILAAQEENRALFGAVIVYDKTP